MTLWFSDPEYVDAVGAPRPLSLRGSALSIEALARRIDPTLDVPTVLKFLQRGWIDQTRRHAIPAARPRDHPSGPGEHDPVPARTLRPLEDARAQQPTGPQGGRVAGALRAQSPFPRERRPCVREASPPSRQTTPDPVRCRHAPPRARRREGRAHGADGGRGVPIRRRPPTAREPAGGFEAPPKERPATESALMPRTRSGERIGRAGPAPAAGSELDARAREAMRCFVRVLARCGCAPRIIEYEVGKACREIPKSWWHKADVRRPRRTGACHDALVLGP